MWKTFPNSNLEYSTVTNKDQTLHLTIQGPKGTVAADKLVVVLDRQDYIEDLYWDIITTLEGNYHCCLTGRVDWL